jgi:RNA polymerase sigma factor (sigma-70 family)
VTQADTKWPPQTSDLLQRINARITVAFRRRGTNRSDADDIAQETLARLLRHWTRLQRLPESSLIAYAHRCAERVRIDSHRSSARARRTQEAIVLVDERVPSAFASVAARQQLARILVASDAMRSTERRVLEAVALGGEALPHVASTIGVPLGTAASTLRRARHIARRAAGEGDQIADCGDRSHADRR